MIMMLAYMLSIQRILTLIWRTCAIPATHTGATGLTTKSTTRYIRTGNIEENMWTTVVARFHAATRTADLWEDSDGWTNRSISSGLQLSLVSTRTCSYPPLTARSLSNAWVGRSSNDEYLNADLAGLFVVDEYMSMEAATSVAEALARGNLIASTENTDWCSSGAQSNLVSKCGDSILSGDEVCDDGGALGGCNDDCSGEERGWRCNNTKCATSVCFERCGDGVRTASEGCDDGNMKDGDGCSLWCTVECGFHCSITEPNTCITTCGDSILAGEEVCDDGGFGGCRENCSRFEPGWFCNQTQCASSECAQCPRCVCVWWCVYVVCVCVCVCVCVWFCVCMYTYIYICTYMYTHAHTHTHIHTYICIYILHIYMYILIYVYIYMCTYI